MCSFWQKSCSIYTNYSRHRQQGKKLNKYLNNLIPNIKLKAINATNTKQGYDLSIVEETCRLMLQTEAQLKGTKHSTYPQNCIWNMCTKYVFTGVIIFMISSCYLNADVWYLFLMYYFILECKVKSSKVKMYQSLNIKLISIQFGLICCLLVNLYLIIWLSGTVKSSSGSDT